MIWIKLPSATWIFERLEKFLHPKKTQNLWSVSRYIQIYTEALLHFSFNRFVPPLIFDPKRLNPAHYHIILKHVYFHAQWNATFKHSTRFYKMSHANLKRFPYKRTLNIISNFQITSSLHVYYSAYNFTIFFLTWDHSTGHTTRKIDEFNL